MIMSYKAIGRSIRDAASSASAAMLKTAAGSQTLNTYEYERLDTLQHDLIQLVYKLHSSVHSFSRQYSSGYEGATAFDTAAEDANKYAQHYWKRIDSDKTRTPSLAMSTQMYDLRNKLEILFYINPSNEIPSSATLEAMNATRKQNKEGIRTEWATEEKRQAWIAALIKHRTEVIRMANKCYRDMNDLIGSWTKVTNFAYTGLKPTEFGAFLTKQAHLQDAISLQTPYTLTEMRLLLPQC